MAAATTPPPPTRVRHLAVAVAAVVGGWLATWYALGSPLWPSLAWSLACFALVLAPLASTTRAVWFNVGAVVLLVGLFQPTLEYVDDEPDCRETVDGEAAWRNDADVGYLPPVSSHYRVTRRCGDALIYSASYTTDAHGLRTAGVRRDGDDVPCVVLVGGSFAFGEGVDDEDTLAQRIWERTEGAYQVRNFGVPGFGANHVLAMLESGLITRAARCDVRLVIYLAISDHIGRVAGSPLGSGDPDGPRYVLTAEGRVRRDGNHDDVRWSAAGLAHAMARTDAGRRLNRRFADDFSEHDRALFAAVLRAIDEQIADAYPHAEFHVLWWDHGAAGGTPLPEPPGIPIHRVTEIVPPVESWEGSYEIARDGHPTARAGDLLADYVVREILRVPPARP